MALLVQKFGGSSLGSLDKIAAVAQRVAARRRAGDDLVVVVSAMQGETDRLLAHARQLAPRPDPREADQLLATGEQASAALLALALHAAGVPARSLTGSQMRLRTDGMFARARIHSLDCDVVTALLQAGSVVVAAGFQGVDATGSLTTLGRGRLRHQRRRHRRGPGRRRMRDLHRRAGGLHRRSAHLSDGAQAQSPDLR